MLLVTDICINPKKVIEWIQWIQISSSSPTVLLNTVQFGDNTLSAASFTGHYS